MRMMYGAPFPGRNQTTLPGRAELLEETLEEETIVAIYSAPFPDGDSGGTAPDLETEPTPDLYGAPFEIDPTPKEKLKKLAWKPGDRVVVRVTVLSCTCCENSGREVIVSSDPKIPTLAATTRVQEWDIQTGNGFSGVEEGEVAYLKVRIESTNRETHFSYRTRVTDRDGPVLPVPESSIVGEWTDL